MKRENYNKLKDILINIENLNKRIHTLEEYTDNNLSGNISICFADFRFKAIDFIDIKMPEKMNAEFINFLLRLSKDELAQSEKELEILLN